MLFLYPSFSSHYTLYIHVPYLYNWWSLQINKLKDSNNIMEGFDEEIEEPVSPTGQYLNSSSLCVSILGILESEIPIDDHQTLSLLQNMFLPINTRFSSIMVIHQIIFTLFMHICPIFWCLKYIFFLF